MLSETHPDPGQRSLDQPEVPAMHPETRPHANPAEPADLLHRLAEPYAFALLLWPAVGALMQSWPAEPWTAYARAALWLWLGVMHLAAYTGGRGAGFGNAVALMSGTVAAACAAFPSPWALAGLPVLMLTLYAAQRLRIATLDGRTASSTESPPEPLRNTN